MTRQWKPGDVALVDSWRGTAQLALRVRRGDEIGWCVFDGTDTRGLEDEEVRSSRPVVVIDPEDREQVRQLVMAYYGATVTSDGLVDSMRTALRSIATPPVPEEPGLYGVVESVHGVEWCRISLSAGGYDYQRLGDPRNSSTPAVYARWNEINVAKVCTPGQRAGEL